MFDIGPSQGWQIQEDGNRTTIGGPETCQVCGTRPAATTINDHMIGDYRVCTECAPRFKAQGWSVLDDKEEMPYAEEWANLYGELPD